MRMRGSAEIAAFGFVVCPITSNGTDCQARNFTVLVLLACGVSAFYGLRVHHVRPRAGPAASRFAAAR
jgi:hypothetical protein